MVLAKTSLPGRSTVLAAKIGLGQILAAKTGLRIGPVLAAKSGPGFGVCIASYIMTAHKMSNASS